MSLVLGTVVPVFLLIVIGHALKRRGFPGDAFWPLAERTNFYLLFPVLLVHSMAQTDLGRLPIGGMSAVLALTALGLTFALVAVRARLGIPGPAFTSVVQGAVRFNAYLGLAVVGTAYGAPGLAIAALYLGVMVPLTNLIAVPVLSVYAAEKRPDVLRIILDVLRNPLIIAFPFGIAFNLLGGLPPWLERTMGMLGQASLPIALLCVGAGLNLAAVRTTRFLVTLSVALKLAGLPLLVWVACPLFGVDGEPRAVLTLLSALPAAPASYILARMMGGDAPLMAAILTTQVALSAATLPAILALLAAVVPPS